MKSPSASRNVLRSFAHGREDATSTPLKAGKKTVSIAGLHGQVEKLRRDRLGGRRDVSTPRRAGTKKQASSARASRGKASASHPLYLNFASVVHNYKEEEARSRSEQLDEVLQDLIAEVNRDNNGNDVSAVTHIGLNSDATALGKGSCKPYRPLDDDTLTRQKTKPDGTSELVDTQLGWTMDKFARTLQQKRMELETLLKDLVAVNSEIAAAKDDALKAGSSQVEDGSDMLQIAYSSLLKEAQASQDETLAEVYRRREEDLAYKVETRRKFQEFVNALV